MNPAPPPAGAPDRLRGIAFMLLAMLLLACMDTVSKKLTADYAVAQILWVRFLIFAAFALYMARRVGLGAGLRSARPGLQVARSLLLVAEIGVFVLAFRYLPLAETHAVAATSPLIVTALAVPILGERVGLRRWAAVLAGFVGALIIIRPGLAAFGAPFLLPLVGAVMFAVYQIMLRGLGRTDRPETTVLYSGLVGAVVLTLVAPPFWRPPDAEGWALLILAGLLGTAAHVVLIKAFAIAPAAALQPFSYALLLFATIFGYLVFADLPDPWTVLGGALVIGGGLYALYRESRRRSAA